MRVRNAAIVTIVLALTVSVLAQVNRRDGRWEVTTEMEMAGLPKKMPAMTTTECITKEQAEDPQRSVPQGRGTPSNCKVADYKITGNTVSWAMKCEGAEAMSGAGEITYGVNTFESVMKMEQKGRTVLMKSTGKRLGDCVK